MWVHKLCIWSLYINVPYLKITKRCSNHFIFAWHFWRKALKWEKCFRGANWRDVSSSVTTSLIIRTELHIQLSHKSTGMQKATKGNYFPNPKLIICHTSHMLRNPK
jgi:hypothetical protein